MSPDGLAILQHLRTVEAEREARARDSVLGERVVAVKKYQHARFERSYTDLLSQPRYGAAARFFLNELYGPHDFSERDAQFARVVPGLVRLFPREIVHTVSTLGELHALSETLDSSMARLLDALPVTAARYTAAWKAASPEADRYRQIDLMLSVARALDRYTRNPVLRHSLRLMRVPAKAAGLGRLQTFLESGFDTFRDMRGADEFLNTVTARERALAAALFSDPSGPGLRDLPPDEVAAPT
jgi:hypothetical protein